MNLLSFENGDKVIAYTYDDYIKVKLIILNQEELVLYDDTKLSFISLYRNYFTDENKMMLAERLENINLGILLNKYYYKIANDVNLYDMFFDENDNGDWIGTRYCCFENDNTATWIYLKKSQLYFECTPLYEGLFEDCAMSFEDFVKNYKSYQNTFNYSSYIEFVIRLKELLFDYEYLE